MVRSFDTLSRANTIEHTPHAVSVYQTWINDNVIFAATYDMQLIHNVLNDDPGHYSVEIADML
jgi:hypothetical protein